MNDCIKFKGNTNANGYGYVHINDTTLLAHRLAWMLDRGKAIPFGKVVMHSCDNPPCINPRHLTLGTHKANHQDSVDKGRAYLKGGGRPTKITQYMIDTINQLRATGMTSKQACKQIGISRAHYNYRNRIGF